MMSCKTKKKISFLRPSYIFCLVSPITCMLLLLNTGLPELRNSDGTGIENKAVKLDKSAREADLGEFGEMMVTMLPSELPFTIFVPSKEAFEHFLRFYSNDDMDENGMNNTFAALSSIMGCSTVPRHLPSRSLSTTEHNAYTVSGHDLYMWKDSDDKLIVNNITCKEVDIRRGEIMIHVIHGVLMGAEFEQSLGSGHEE